MLKLLFKNYTLYKIHMLIQDMYKAYPQITIPKATVVSLANKSKSIHTVVIVKCSWHVFPRKTVGGVRDHQTGLTDRTVAH